MSSEFRKYIDLIESIATVSSEHHNFLVDKHGLSSYSNCLNEYSFIDRDENKLSIKDMLEYLNENGYKKVIGPSKDFAGFIGYIFAKGNGRQKEDQITFDTKNGKFVRNIHETVYKINKMDQK